MPNPMSLKRGRLKARWPWFLGAAVVGVAVMVWPHHAPPPGAPTRQQASPARPNTPTPAPAKTSGVPKSPPAATSPSVQASFAAASGLSASTSLEVATLPWDPTARWAVDPMAHDQNGFPPTLWVGAQTGAHPWTWYPSRLPGHEPSQMPLGPRTALEETYDLHAGMPGPQLLGPISWAALTGHVSRPRGITLAVLPADASPTGTAAVELTVWMHSDTASYAGYYGLQTIWDAANAATGKHDINGFVAEPTLAAAVAAPNP